MRKMVLGDLLHIGPTDGPAGGKDPVWNIWQGPDNDQSRWDHFSAASWEFYLERLRKDFGLGR